MLFCHADTEGVRGRERERRCECGDKGQYSSACVSGPQQRVQWVRADQRDHVNNTASTEWAAPLSPASVTCLPASLSVSTCFFPPSLFVFVCSFPLGFVSYFIFHSALSFSPLIRSTSLLLSLSFCLSFCLFFLSFKSSLLWPCLRLTKRQKFT